MVKTKAIVFETMDFENTEINIDLPDSIIGKTLDKTSHYTFLDTGELDLNSPLFYRETVFSVNEFLLGVNSHNPELDNDMLSAICVAAETSGVENMEALSEIIENNRFYIEDFTSIASIHEDVEVGCAQYLAIDKQIPFNSEVSSDDLLALYELSPYLIELIFWETIWDHYTELGFSLVDVNEKLYLVLIRT